MSLVCFAIFTFGVYIDFMFCEDKDLLLVLRALDIDFALYYVFYTWLFSFSASRDFSTLKRILNWVSENFVKEKVGCTPS